MQIGIATIENHLRSDIDMYFGRANCFCIYNRDAGNYVFIENPAKNDKANHGLIAAEVMIANGVKIVVAGRFGIKVSDFFRKNNIQMVIPNKDITLLKFINKLTKDQTGFNTP
ncbi:NifB/NifX family molybdenum-iron cluster-binding protein [Haoranjiania flava]|uniref:Dinitrogenase iron-molybdenum cofactor biosynthesis domain-containing protein n=1 Tax=Haoranjiania flava TaxID=1856322 RepID=A0AAE3IL62_9BACT|nr:NifB/NifX family molybdenum-iron cluster-binding protein [Haoranjiania flava]MCU7693694.1 hypothetical protein [Haoranjiania flava]